MLLNLGTFQVGDGERLGLVLPEVTLDLAALAAAAGEEAAAFASMQAFVEAGAQALAAAHRLQAYAAEQGMARFALPAGARLLAPFPRPRRSVFCIGRNYYEHIVQGDRAWGNQGMTSVPIFFSKLPENVIGPGAPIEPHPDVTRELDYEGELCVVIGRRGRDIPAEKALEYIAGYTILNDVTARDVQNAHKQWFKGKNLDTFCPMGPYLVTADSFDGYPRVQIKVWVDDELRQDMHTDQMIFDIPTSIASLSRGFTLEPGDIIATGTGPGCGFAFEPPRFLRPGQVVRIWVEGIGELVNPVGRPSAA